MTHSPPALILDRDGTLNAMVCNPKGDQDSPYFHWQLEFYPNLKNLLNPWVNAQIPIFIVTNQPGIAKGHFKKEDLDCVHKVFQEHLMSQGIPLAEIIFCPHHPVGGPQGDRSLIGDCDCRKPKPGMIFQIQKKYGIDLSQAIFIGDSQVDQQAAEAAGVGTFFMIRTLVSDRVPEDKRVINFPGAPPLNEILTKLASQGFALPGPTVF